MSRSRPRLVAKRIEGLQRLASDLDGCIACECLSLGKCGLEASDTHSDRVTRTARPLLYDIR